MSNSNTRLVIHTSESEPEILACLWYPSSGVELECIDLDLYRLSYFLILFSQFFLVQKIRKCILELYC